MKNLKDISVFEGITTGFQYFKNEKMTKIIVDRTISKLTDKSMDRINRYVANEYYKEAGELQWNMYYLIIAERDSVPVYLLSEIEDNVEYAKKVVLSEQQLELFIYEVSAGNCVQMHREDIFLKIEKDSFDFIGAIQSSNKLKVSKRTVQADNLFRLFNFDKVLSTRQSCFEYELYNYVTESILSNKKDIFIEGLSHFSSEIEFLRILDTLRFCVSTYDINLHIYTPRSKELSLLNKKFYLFKP